MTDRMTTNYYCQHCGKVTTGSRHAYCLGSNHFASIAEHLESMRTAFGIGNRKAARQQLGYLIAVAQLWHDELGEDEE